MPEDYENKKLQDIFNVKMLAECNKENSESSINKENHFSTDHSNPNSQNCKNLVELLGIQSGDTAHASNYQSNLKPNSSDEYFNCINDDN